MRIVKEEEKRFMNEKHEGAVRDARVLGIPKMLLLGVQHMFAMFGATILVPILVMGYFQEACGEPLTRGVTVSTTLFCAGFGTLLFHVLTKLKVPAFLGSSFAFLGGFYTVANLNSGIYAGMSANDKVAYACGGIVVAGLLYLVLALIIKLVGVKRVMKFLPPVVTGPIIICIGLSLASSAISNASTNWLIAIVALATIIVFNIWGKGMFKIIPILMGVVVAYVFAVVLNALGFTNPDGSAIISFAEVAADSWVGLPKFQLCKFDLTAILVMAPIAIASMMEHIGDMSAISATVGENFIEDPGLHRTLMGDGLATAFAGLLGGPANTTYGENTGVLELSRVYDPRVIRLAAVFAVILSFIPKFSAVISTMPTAIIGGVSFMLYGMISAIGVRNVVENQVDLTKSRNLIIAGVIFVCALGFSDGLTFQVGGASITLTALAIAAIAGIVLNAILPGNDYEFGTNPKGDQSRGVFLKSSDSVKQDEE
jgi:uracil permease